MRQWSLNNIQYCYVLCVKPAQMARCVLCIVCVCVCAFVCRTLRAPHFRWDKRSFVGVAVKKHCHCPKFIHIIMSDVIIWIGSVRVFADCWSLVSLRSLKKNGISSSRSLCSVQWYQCLSAPIVPKKLARFTERLHLKVHWNMSMLH